jgi:hypothetical protein
MKYAILLLIIAIPSLTIAQTKRQLNRFPYVDRLTKRQEKQQERNVNCMVTTKYSIKELREFYPFNTASSVSIVSFHSDTAFTNRLPLVNGEIDYAQIRETRILDRGEIDSLASILYNVTYRGEIFIISGTGCYNPRNAVLFFDSNNHLLEFIELCFECHGQRLSSEKISLGDLCSQKSDMIKDFFFRQGIKVGTTKRIE